MQLSFKFTDEDKDTTFAGNLAPDEVEYLLQYAIQNLMKLGLMQVQHADDEKAAH